MFNQKIHELFEKYRAERKVMLTIDQFIYVVKLFPVMKVCISDGILQSEEWSSLLQNARAMGELFSNADYSKEELVKIINQEFLYIISSLHTWEGAFMDALYAHLVDHPSDKLFINDAMQVFAAVSDGLSDMEIVTIQEIRSRLML